MKTCWLSSAHTRLLCPVCQSDCIEALKDVEHWKVLPPRDASNAVSTAASTADGQSASTAAADPALPESLAASTAVTAVAASTADTDVAASTADTAVAASTAAADQALPGPSAASTAVTAVAASTADTVVAASTADTAVASSAPIPGSDPDSTAATAAFPGATEGDSGTHSPTSIGSGNGSRRRRTKGPEY